MLLVLEGRHLQSHHSLVRHFVPVTDKENVRKQDTSDEGGSVVDLGSVSILGFENCQSFFPTTAHVRTVCRNARRTAMRGAHQFDWHNTCRTLKTAAEHHIQTTV